MQFAVIACEMTKRALVAAVPMPFAVVSFLVAAELVWPWEFSFWHGHQGTVDVTGNWVVGSLTTLSLVGLMTGFIAFVAGPIIDHLEKWLFPSTGMVMPTLDATVEPPNAEEEHQQGQ